MTQSIKKPSASKATAPKKEKTVKEAVKEPVVDETPKPEPPVQISPYEVPEVVDQAIIEQQQQDIAPGTGIDTDGDGNAEAVIEPESEAPVHVDHDDDYIGKVKISGNMQDVHDKKDAAKLVKNSNIHNNHKEKMLDQIKQGELQHPYKETFKRIRDANNAGSVYRPGIEGI